MSEDFLGSKKKMDHINDMMDKMFGTDEEMEEEVTSELQEVWDRRSTR